MRALAILTFIICIFLSVGANAAEKEFDTWLNDFRLRAQSEGISQPTIDSALTGITPITRVIELDRKQPESTITFATYKNRIVNQTRIKKGRQLYRQHKVKLDKVADKFGVQPQYIVALWGIETNFGSNTGGFDVISSLATLAWDGRRSEFFSKELINALRIIDQGHISRDVIKGSWAGALGQNQFMPSSFHSFAVDGNADGKKDIWGSLDDVFSSSANYLSRSGWKAGERWGRAVRVPAGLSETLVSLKIKKSLSEWQALGVRNSSGGNLPVNSDMKASLVAPDGLAGPTYLVYNNYHTIMRWNRSTYFATSVGLLADAIAQ